MISKGSIQIKMYSYKNPKLKVIFSCTRLGSGLVITFSIEGSYLSLVLTESYTKKCIVFSRSTIASDEFNF